MVWRCDPAGDTRRELFRQSHVLPPSGIAGGFPRADGADGGRRREAAGRRGGAPCIQLLGFALHASIADHEKDADAEGSRQHVQRLRSASRPGFPVLAGRGADRRPSTNGSKLHFDGRFHRVLHGLYDLSYRLDRCQ